MIRCIAALGLVLCIAWVPCPAGFAAEGVPQLLNYQGKLANSLGKPVDGSKEMIFEFHDAAVDGNLLGCFSETQQVVVTKGVFNVLIGSATEGGVPASVFDGTSVYLSVKVDGQDLSPRQRIASVAYAFRADDAGSLNGVPGADVNGALADVQARLSALEATLWTLVIEPPQGNGSTSPPSGTYVSHVGSTVTVTATPEPPWWQLSHWEGTAVAGTPNTNPVTITSATPGQKKTLKAVFAEHIPIAPMCFVPAGTFTTSTGVQVYLDAYLIDAYEVTNELYVRFLNAGGNDWYYQSSQAITRLGPAPYTYQVVTGFKQKPVVSMEYGSAIAFCNWRSTTEGLPAGSYRLPTEAEWEKAAGWTPGRTTLWTYAYESDTIDCSKANLLNCFGAVIDVGHYTGWKSYYGCYDMTGNVTEWCSDWSGGVYPGSPSNPTGPATGLSKVLRGGSFYDSVTGCRIANRGSFSPDDIENYLGFRCVRKAQ